MEPAFTTLAERRSSDKVSIKLFEHHTVWKLSKYEVISGPYFPVFRLNAGKYGPEMTPYLDTFHAVSSIYYHTLSFRLVLLTFTVDSNMFICLRET